MTETVFIHKDGLSKEEAFLDALTAPEEGTRIMARAVASGYPDKMAEWVQSEVERGTDRTELMMSIMSLQLQELASFSAALMAPTADAVIAKAIGQMALERLPEFAAKIRARANGAPAPSTG